MNNYARRIFLICFAIFAFGCSDNQPQSALDEMAEALERNEPARFLARLDLPLYAANYTASLMENDEALSALNSLSSMIGLGSLDKLVGEAVDMRSRLEQRFSRGVSNGELMAQCREAKRADCPWIPQSLRDAKVIVVAKDAAVAAVTTPQKLTSWLALREEGDVWKVIGLAADENEARSFAVGEAKPAARKKGAPEIPPVKPVVPEEAEPATI